MGNFEVGESSSKKYKATDTNDDQIPIELFMKTTSPKYLSPAYPLSTSNLTLTLATHPNDPLDTDLANFLKGKAHNDSEHVPLRNMDLEKKDRMKQYRKASKKSNAPKKNKLEELNDKAIEIARETSMICKEIMRYSQEILDYEDENETLLEELRGVCDQNTISRYESLNPNTRSPVRPSSNQSDRDNNIASSSSDHSTKKKPSSVVKTRI